MDNRPGNPMETGPKVEQRVRPFVPQQEAIPGEVPGPEISIHLPQTSQPGRSKPHPSKRQRRRTKRQQDRRPTQTAEVSRRSADTPSGQGESPAADVGSAAGRDTRQMPPASSGEQRERTSPSDQIHYPRQTEETSTVRRDTGRMLPENAPGPKQWSSQQDAGITAGGAARQEPTTNPPPQPQRRGGSRSEGTKHDVLPAGRGDPLYHGPARVATHSFVYPSSLSPDGSRKRI